MAQQVIQSTIPSPGLEGLNTELGGSMPDPRFAIVADNVVIDRIGRIQSREAFSYFASPPFVDFGEHSIMQLGTEYIFDSNNTYLIPKPVCIVKSEEYEIGDISYPAKRALAVYDLQNEQLEVEEIPYTLDWTADNGMFVNFKDDLYFFCKEKEVIQNVPSMTPSGPIKWRHLSDDPLFQGPVYDDADRTDRVIDGDIACSAYGRLWVAGVDDDYQVIHYCSLLDPLTWYDGRSRRLIRVMISGTLTMQALSMFRNTGLSRSTELLALPLIMVFWLCLAITLLLSLLTQIAVIPLLQVASFFRTQYPMLD